MTLFWLLNYYHEQLEADLGWPVLRGFWRGKGTARRLWVRIKHLPRESSTKRALGGPDAEWGTTEYLLAVIGDALTGHRLPRPGDVERERVQRAERAAVWEARRAERARQLAGRAAT